MSCASAVPNSVSATSDAVDFQPGACSGTDRSASGSITEQQRTFRKLISEHLQMQKTVEEVEEMA